MQRPWIFGLALIGALFFGLAHAHAGDDADDSAAAKKRSNTLVVDYTGKLQDEQSKPISGVFHLGFNLYDSEHAAHAAWREQHFVAVVDGEYSVPLGTRRDLQRAAIPPGAWIGVELVGEGEVLRDRFKIGASDAASQASKAEQFELTEETQKLLEQARDGKRIAYADIAERAVSADRAEVAKRAESIGEFSVEELEQKANLALERLGDHVSDPDAHAATGGLRIGDERKVQRRIGGTGGSNYEVNCPPGHVVTGIKGSAGKLVDGISIICRKLR